MKHHTFKENYGSHNGAGPSLAHVRGFRAHGHREQLGAAWTKSLQHGPQNFLCSFCCWWISRSTLTPSRKKSWVHTITDHAHGLRGVVPLKIAETKKSSHIVDHAHGPKYSFTLRMLLRELGFSSPFSFFRSAAMVLLQVSSHAFEDALNLSRLKSTVC